MQEMFYCDHKCSFCVFEVFPLLWWPPTVVHTGMLSSWLNFNAMVQFPHASWWLKYIVVCFFEINLLFSRINEVKNVVSVFVVL